MEYNNYSDLPSQHKHGNFFQRNFRIFNNPNHITDKKLFDMNAYDIENLNPNQVGYDMAKRNWGRLDEGQRDQLLGLLRRKSGKGGKSRKHNKSRKSRKHNKSRKSRKHNKSRKSRK